MYPKTVRYFWTTLAVLLPLCALAYLWVRADTSCSGYVMSCISYSMRAFILLLFGSPAVLLAVSIVALWKDFHAVDADEQDTLYLKRAIRAFFLILILGFFARVVWYYNYHQVFIADSVLLLSIVLLGLASELLSVIYLQYLIRHKRDGS